jgi:ABC-2 type transport system ATP-binding protein
MAAGGVTVFVTTHYMDEAEYCNRLVLIYRGKIVASGSPMELKRDAMRGELVLVQCDQLSNAIEALQHVEGVDDVAVFGNALHLVVDNAERAIGSIRNALEQKSIKVERIERIRPSLEDVFVSVTTRDSQKEVA